MHLGPKVPSIKLSLLSASWDGYSLNYTLWHTGVTKFKYQPTVLLTFVPQIFASSEHWHTPEQLLVYLQHEFYMECTLAPKSDDNLTEFPSWSILNKPVL